MLTATEITDALRDVKSQGLVSLAVRFDQLETAGSRTHRFCHRVHIAVTERDAVHRRYSNSGTCGASGRWSATWEDWGWFIAEIFRCDPGARAGRYDSADHFRELTGNLFGPERSAVPGGQLQPIGEPPRPPKQPAVRPGPAPYFNGVTQPVRVTA
jgi:hypothetical protein